jgi:hypothetical protein
MIRWSDVVHSPLLALILLTACSRSPSNPGGEDLVYTPHEVTSARLGESVTFSIEVENPSDRELKLPLGLGQYSFDPVVVGLDQRQVWRRWSGVVTDIPTEYVPIPPHGRVTFSVSWDLTRSEGGPVSPGTYRVYYRLVGEDLSRPLVDTHFDLEVLPS